MTNVIQIGRFTMIWGLLGILAVSIGYSYLKKSDSRITKYLLDQDTSKESISRIVRVFLEMVLAVIILGMLVMISLPIGSMTEHQVRIIVHG